jgi:GNAT superfamily N-acetyltransferase
MSTIIVRRAQLADADTIAAFNRALAEETEGRRLDPAIVASGVRRLLADPALGVYYLAERDGSVVGQLQITTEYSDWRDGVFWWIQSVYVHPAARRRQIYRALHEHVERAARAAGHVCGLRLYVVRHNLAAQQVYQSLGMRQTDYCVYENDWTRAGEQPR